MIIITRVKSISLLFFVYLISISCFAQEKASSKSLTDYKNTLIAVNNVFLKTLFIDNYMDNKNYFMETDLSNEDLTGNFKKANLLLKSMQLSVTGDSLAICAKGLDFNDNYLTLYRIKQGNTLKEKYHKEKVNQAVNEIEQLPALETGSKLSRTKVELADAIRNYAIKTTALKTEIDSWKKHDQDNPKVKAAYLNLEKQHKSYPYLIRIIRESKNSNNYQTDLEVPDLDSVKSQIKHGISPINNGPKPMVESEKARKEEKVAVDNKKVNNP